MWVYCWCTVEDNLQWFTILCSSIRAWSTITIFPCFFRLDQWGWDKWGWTNEVRAINYWMNERLNKVIKSSKTGDSEKSGHRTAASAVLVPGGATAIAAAIADTSINAAIAAAITDTSNSTATDCASACFCYCYCYYHRFCCFCWCYYCYFLLLLLLLVHGFIGFGSSTTSHWLIDWLILYW